MCYEHSCILTVDPFGRKYKLCFSPPTIYTCDLLSLFFLWAKAYFCAYTAPYFTWLQSTDKRHQACYILESENTFLCFLFIMSCDHSEPTSKFLPFYYAFLYPNKLSIIHLCKDTALQYSSVIFFTNYCTIQ